MMNPNRKPLSASTPTSTPEEVASYVAARVRASQHRAAIQAASTCACFFCFKKFPATEIKTWVDANQTALCPHCGIDAVLGAGEGFRIDDRFLRKMHQHHFATRAK